MLWFMLMLSPTNSPFFSSQIRTLSYSINWPSLVSTARSPVILWRLWSHKPSHKQDSNKVICDHKSDETRSVTHENKAYLVWFMFRMISNQHYPHRANQKLRSWANAIFQNRGLCGQAVPSFPSPSPIIHVLLSQLSRWTSRGNACYAGYSLTSADTYRRDSYCFIARVFQNLPAPPKQYGDFQSFFQLENLGSHLAMCPDDRFLPKGKQILPEICQVRPMPMT